MLSYLEAIQIIIVILRGGGTVVIFDHFNATRIDEV